MHLHDQVHRVEDMGELSRSREVPHLHLVRVGNKKPTKKTQKTHLKKPTKNVFFGFGVFKNFFMKIIQTFLFETDFFMNK
jgi:hypothetical protein